MGLSVFLWDAAEAFYIQAWPGLSIRQDSSCWIGPKTDKCRHGKYGVRKTAGCGLQQWGNMFSFAHVTLRFGKCISTDTNCYLKIETLWAHSDYKNKQWNPWWKLWGYNTGRVKRQGVFRKVGMQTGGSGSCSQKPWEYNLLQTMVWQGWKSQLLSQRWSIKNS